MILQSLVKYYEILSNDEENDIPRQGYCKANVSYAVNLSVKGELINIIPLKISVQRGKRVLEIPQSMEVPAQEKKASGIVSNFLCENSSYMFGIDSKGKPKRAKDCFKAFKQRHLDILQDVNNAEAKAIVQYVENWDVEKAMEHPALAEYLDEILLGANLVFKINGGDFAQCNKEIRLAWERYCSHSEDSKVMQCLVTGKEDAIARLHPSIKGVKDAQPSGASIVSFNSRAFESYGRDEQQGLNAPISEYVAFAYTTVLNHLLTDTAHKLYLGDSTIVFWAESTKGIYQNFMTLLINGDTANNDKALIDDEVAASEVKAIFEKIAQGKPIDDLSDAFDQNTKFHILALAPNAARLSVRFFLSNSFGEFVKRIFKHYEDIRIEKQYSNDPNAIPLWRLLNETVPQKSTDKAASPLLAGATLKAIINGAPYPANLYNSIMIRIKADQNINYFRTSIIKAFLLRQHESFSKYKEVLTMSLNEQSTSKPYILGRLFAILENTQKDASPGINTTIKDRFFTSACATPATVFPVLLRLTQHHIAKGQYGKLNDKRIEDILERLDIDNNSFPSHLSLEEQGVFILGYYHQRNAMYQKNSKSEENE